MPAASTKNPRILKRNQTIRQKYKELTEKKHLDSDYAISLLEELYITLNQTTLWLIITQTGHYKNY